MNLSLFLCLLLFIAVVYIDFRGRWLNRYRLDHTQRAYLEFWNWNYRDFR